MGKRLGRFISTYRAEYFDPDKRNMYQIFTYKPKPGAEARIYEAIDDITISMKSKDYLNLPSLTLNTVPVEMSSSEQDLYDEMKSQLVISTQGKQIDALNAASLSNKLSQMANVCVYDDQQQMVQIHQRKLDALEDLIEAANRKPVLVAYWFKHDREQIKSHFSAREIKSVQDIQDWNLGRIPVALIHPASAGHGLNLQAGGATLIWYGLTWSLELYQQTNARLWRQGQTEPVVIHHLVTQGTIDENILAALKRKDKTQAALINAVQANLKGSVVA